MKVLAGISILLLIVASAVVGIRLIRMWRRTRQLPELSIGLLLMFYTMLGYPLFVLSRAEESIGFVSAWISLVLGAIAVDAGFLMLYLFTWKTFRPHARWCAWLVAAAAVACAVNVATLAADTWSARSCE